MNIRSHIFLAPRLSLYHLISSVPQFALQPMLGGEGHESPAAQLAAAALPRGREAVHDGYDGQQRHGAASHTRALVLPPTMPARGRGTSSTPSPRRRLRTLYFWGSCKTNIVHLLVHPPFLNFEKILSLTANI